MPEENKPKTNPSASGAGMIQQGYETSLQKTAGIINDFNFSNDKNRSQIVNNFKDNLMSLDRDVVKAVFDGAGAIRNKPDETFSIQALPGMAIPKKIVQELKVLPKKFFEEYDAANRTKNEIVNQAKAGSIAEGAETKLSAAKQAVFGQGFGAIGTALGSAVGLKPRTRRAPASKQAPDAATEKTADKQERIEKITRRSDKQIRKPAPKTIEEQDQDVLKEEREDIKKKQAQKATIKTRPAVDVALYQKNFNEVLDNLEKDPDPFANQGAAFFGIRKLKQEIRQAVKKDPQPVLKNLYDRLDELGSEYRTAQLEQKTGKNGKARLLAAVKDVRAMSGQSAPASLTPDTSEIDQEWTRLAEAPAPGQNVTVFKAAPLSPPPAPLTANRQAVPASKTPKAFAPTSTDIKERLGQISKRETELQQKITELKQPALDSGKKMESTQEIILLEQELEQLNPQKQALNKLQQSLSSQAGTVVPSPELIKTELAKISGQETQINNRLTKIDLEHKALKRVGRQQPGYQAATQQRQSLEQERAGLIRQTKNLNPQKQALQNLLRDVEKLGRASIGAGLAGVAGAALMGAGTPASAAVPTAGKSAVDIQAGLKSQTTAQAPTATPSVTPAGQTPKPTIQIQAQAQSSQEASMPAPSVASPRGRQAQIQTRASQPASSQSAITGSSERRSKLESYGSEKSTGLTALSTSTPSNVLVQAPSPAGDIELSITEPAKKIKAQTDQAPGSRTAQAAMAEAAGEAPIQTGASIPSSAVRAPTGTGGGTASVARRIKRSRPGSRTGKQSATPSRAGYQKVGPQEIKPPIGRGLDLGRAMNLASGQAMAGKQSAEARPAEGFNLSTGGLETGLSEGDFMTSAIPTQDAFLYNPLRTYNQPSVYAQRAPGAAYETEENEDEYMSAGGEVQSDLERLSALEASKQKSRALTGQLLGPDAGIGMEPKAVKQSAPSLQAEEFMPGEREQAWPKEIPRLMRLEAARGSKIQKIAQARQKITELKDQFESAKKAVQQFRDLKNVGELLASVSGWTLLALWLEWNLDLINKRIANNSIPFLEKGPGPNASPWEKGKHSVKDGVTLFANIFIPISALASFLMPLIITAIITLSALGAVGVAFLGIANFFGISIL